MRFERIAWQADTPFGTAIEVQIRTAATYEALENAPWRGPTGAADFYRQPDAVVGPHPSGDRWAQCKVSLISPNQANSPVLKSISIEYEPTAE